MASASNLICRLSYSAKFIYIIGIDKLDESKEKRGKEHSILEDIYDSKLEFEATDLVHFCFSGNL